MPDQLTKIDAPKRIGPTKDISLRGLLIPWLGNNPALVHMLGVSSMVYYLPLFKDEEHLKYVMKEAGSPIDRVRVVSNVPEFLKSIPPEIFIITDIRLTVEGKIRFKQVER